MPARRGVDGVTRGHSAGQVPRAAAVLDQPRPYAAANLLRTVQRLGGQCVSRGGKPCPSAAALSALLLAGALSAGCSDDDKSSLSDQLGSYTDAGDGCQQTVSAIAYADNTLRAAGQEQHQEFDDAVRSNIAAVAGTIALEIHDFPTKGTLQQAR